MRRPWITDIFEFLKRIDVLPWDSIAAASYGKLRASLQKKGNALGNLDMLIASHALSLDIVLITHDSAFKYVTDLKTEDWLQ